MRIAFIFLSGFTLWASAACAAEPAISNFTLKNGLEVIVIENHRVPAVSHTIWYRIGAADDPQGKSGLAHYHEHAMFLGTANYKSGEYADIVTRQGGEQNAFTSRDLTGYYINIAKEKLPLAMELEADRMRGLVLSDADMAKEREIIIEERRMRIENNPGALLSEQVNAAMFLHHPYHIPTIGWMHEMQKLSKNDVLDFHKTWYHPNNAILIVSGDVTPPQVRALAEKYYGPLPKVAVPARVWNQEPPHNTARHITMHHVNVKQPEWVKNYMAPSMKYGKSEEAMPLLVLSQLLGGGKGSRLYQALVVKQKLAVGIDVDYDGFSIGPGDFSVSATPQEQVSVETLEKAVNGELAAFLASNISDEEFARAKAGLKAQSIYAREGLSGVAQIMGYIRMIGLNQDFFTRWPYMIDAVTKEQVMQAAQDTLQDKQSVTALLLPEEKAP